MDENEINNINKKLNQLIKKNDLLEEKNKKFEERLKKAEEIILDLNKQQIFLRTEYRKSINDLEEKYNTILDNLSKKISQLEEKYKNKNEKNEIIINKEQNNNKELLNIKEVNDLIQKSVTQKFDLIQNNIFDLFASQKEIKIDKKQEKKINENIKKFEDYLTKIYDDKNENIPKNLEYDLKKLFKALIIQGKDPLVLGDDFFKKLLVNKEQNADIFKNIINKKLIIFNKIEKILIEFKNKIKKDDKEFRIKFREKYGITEKDISDKKLDKLIQKYEGKEKLIIAELLLNLKYILKSDDCK